MPVSPFIHTSACDLRRELRVGLRAPRGLEDLLPGDDHLAEKLELACAHRSTAANCGSAASSLPVASRRGEGFCPR